MVRLTSKEEEILGYFWAKGPLFVRELLDLQEESKPHYNTLSTIVRSLEEKGYIGYKVYGNTHQYYALVSEDEYRRNSLKQVISNIMTTRTPVRFDADRRRGAHDRRVTEADPADKNNKNQRLWTLFFYTY